MVRRFIGNTSQYSNTDKHKIYNLSSYALQKTLIGEGHKRIGLHSHTNTHRLPLPNHQRTDVSEVNLDPMSCYELSNSICMKFQTQLKPRFF